MTALALPTSTPWTRRPARPAWLLVLLLHGAVAVSLWKLPAWRDRGGPAPQRPPLVLRLWWAKPEPAAPRPAAARPPRPTANPAQTEPQAITQPPVQLAQLAQLAPQRSGDITPAAPVSDTTSAAPAAAAAGTALHTPPTPLNLSLPRSASAPWRQRNPALDDPRSNTAKLTLEQKLAHAMGGDGSWHEERLDLDTVRWRRGSECILATRSRAGQLELGSNGAFRNSWLVRAC